MVDLDYLETYDFTFRAIDEEGAYCRYEAVLTYAVPAAGRCYLVYVDAEPDARGEVATYASILLNPEVAEKAQLAVDSGSTPKKPPLLDLAPLETDGEYALVDAVLAAVEELGDEE